MTYDLALCELLRINERLSIKDKTQYSDGLIDLLYQIGIAELVGRLSNDDVICIANMLIKESRPEDYIYRSVMTDFILFVGMED